MEKKNCINRKSEGWLYRHFVQYTSNEEFQRRGFERRKRVWRSLGHEKPGLVYPGSLSQEYSSFLPWTMIKNGYLTNKRDNVVMKNIYKGVCIYRSGVLSHWYSISFFTSHKINFRKIKLISSSIGLIQHAQIKRNTAPSACPISPYTTNKIPRLREDALILEVPSRIVDHDPRTALAR